MTYELAKRLKDAGFPQENKHWYWATFTFPYTLWCINALEAKTLEKEYECLFAAPTLDDLVSALGPDFQSIHRMPNGMFRAVGRKADMRFPASSIKSDPLEAVAEVFIKLNTKDNEQPQTVTSA
jgi:hypothetical protein